MAFTTIVAGVTHNNDDGSSRQDAIRAYCKPGTPLLLVREPNNKFDPGAVAVWLIEPRRQLGYLKKDIADVAARMDAGENHIATVEELETFDGNVGLKISVSQGSHAVSPAAPSNAAGGQTAPAASPPRQTAPGPVQIKATAPTKKKAGLGKILLIGAGGVAGLCMLCTVVAIVVPSPAPTRTPSSASQVAAVQAKADAQASTATVAPAETIAPTNTQGPTVTPVPTETPQPTETSGPTDTPEPTNTPEPTDTPDPSALSADEQAYVDNFQSNLKLISSAYSDLGEQSTKVGEDPALLFSDEWKLATASVLARFQIVADDIDKQTPPARFRAAHVNAKRLAKSLRDMTNLYATGVDRNDANRIARSIVEQRKSVAYMGTVLAQLALGVKRRSVSGYIDREQLGAAWPLKMDAVVMQCRTSESGDPEVVAVDEAGNVYAINGLAKDNRDYKPVEPVWLADPARKGARIPIVALLNYGLEQCQ